MTDPMLTPTLLCIVPNPSIDRTAEVDRLVPGSIHRPSTVVAVPGGKGLNVARAARTLGTPVRAVALLAGHAGRWIEAELDRLGVDHAAAWGAGETRTCLSVLDHASGRMTEFYESGGRVSAVAWRTFERLVRTEIRHTMPGSLVALSGSLPVGVEPAAAARIVSAARTAGHRALVDTSGPWLRAALAAGPDVVKVNAEEAATLLGRPVGDERDALGAAKRVVAEGAGAAIITLGARGAVGWDGDAGWAVDPPSVEGRHVVGSGDAFLAGFAVAAASGRGFEGGLRSAAAAAAASTLVAGPGNLERRAARRMLRATTLRRLH